MNKEYIPWIISGLTVIVSTFAASMAYFNYRLNKTLLVKNKFSKKK